jgi:hypothetical protein
MFLYFHAYRLPVEKPENLYVSGKIILKWILEDSNVVLWAGSFVFG